MAQTTTVSVLLFAGMRDALGCERIAIELASPSPPAALRAVTAAVHPALAAWLPQCRIACDHSFVAEDSSIDWANCEAIALIPPVSGG